jgi:Icc-related predicted phosphoesterase
MRIVTISDTHLRHNIVVPDGDVLIHAGDLTMSGSIPEVIEATHWLHRLPHKYKVVVAGNHDWLFQLAPEKARSLMNGLVYLQDEEIMIEGYHIFGTPWQPAFLAWAFNVPRGRELQEKWKTIPDHIDILVVHGPPMYFQDSNGKEHVGSEELLERLLQINPLLVVCGHIHEGYGESYITLRDSNIHVVNACICDEKYRPVNQPIIIELEDRI